MSSYIKTKPETEADADAGAGSPIPWPSVKVHHKFVSADSCQLVGVDAGCTHRTRVPTTICIMDIRKDLSVIKQKYGKPRATQPQSIITIACLIAIRKLH